MTGIHWLKESGFLISPIALTNTHSVGVAHQALVEYSSKHGFADMWSLPVVAETYDGYLNDADAFHLTREHVFDAIHNARSGTVSEGNVGGGTGMICHDFKGGIGTSSRLVEIEGSPYSVGVLVQSNYGNRNSLRVDGVPFGRMITPEHTPVPHLKLPTQPEAVSSSIIVIVATDAPLLPLQCTRLAQRATVGLSRVGGTGNNGSGDLFLAFSTHNHVVNGARSVQSAAWLPQPHLSRLFEAVAEATEESILNALCAAETMTGFKGRIVYELPQEALVRPIR